MVGTPSKPELRLRGRILLAEDAPDTAEVLQAILEQAGLDVDLAQDGTSAVRQALAAAAAGQPHALILMDMQMPGCDGCEATRRLRASGWQAPIVALTAYVAPTERRRFRAAGGNGFLSKPVTRRRLLTKLQQYLGAESAVPAADSGWGEPSGISAAEQARLQRLMAEHLPPRLEQLAQACRDQDRQRVAEAAHRLAGAAGLYGWRELAAAALRLEEQTRSGTPFAELAESVSVCVAAAEDNVARPGTPGRGLG